jgi:hypothetical protein
VSARRGGGRDQACERKVNYADRPSAATAMSGMAGRTGQASGQLHVYRCPYEPFPHWHVGHKPRRRGGHP